MSLKTEFRNIITEWVRDPSKRMSHRQIQSIFQSRWKHVSLWCLSNWRKELMKGAEERWNKFESMAYKVSDVLDDTWMLTKELKQMQEQRHEVSKWYSNWAFELSSKSVRIQTLEQLIEECEINLSEWDIDRYVINKWEVWTKVDNKIITEPLYQVKAWLKKKKYEVWVDYNEIIKCIKPIIVKWDRTHRWHKNAMLVITDEHVWLNPSWQYWYQYTREILMSKIQDVIRAVEFEEIHNLYVVFCGDGLDGRQWQTTRWGHKLPQSYTSPEAFDIYVTFKVSLLNSLAMYADNVIVKNVSNSNHWWDFEHIANITVWKLLDNSIFEYEVYSKFINHFTVWDRCFIITHWKDDIDMKYWLPLNLNDKAIIYINNYIRANNITSKEITVIKWDLHQSAYNKTQTFEYHNFPSFAPPSKWVQNNFGDSYSWFSLLTFDDNYLSRTDYNLYYDKS